MNYLILYLIRYVLFIGVFFGSWMLVTTFFPQVSETVRLIIPAVLAIVLTPRVQKIDTQNGKKMQLTWLFLKKPLLVEK